MVKRTIPLFKVFTAPEAAGAVADVLASGYLGQGAVVEDFEDRLCRHFGTTYVNTLNSATSGLELAVRMAQKEFPHRDEVLTTPLTCTATNFAILAAGVKIKWVDVDPETGNVDLDDLEYKLNGRSLAIMVVHWGGYPCDLDEIWAIRNLHSNRNGFSVCPIIEDCAHAWGATYDDKLVGTHGNIAVFSFQAIKHLTTGDGGCMVSPTEEHYQRVKLLRWYGLDRTSSADFRCAQNIKEWGFKFHMNDIAAAIGCANFPHAEKLVQRHRENGHYFNERLAGVSGLTLMENKTDRESSYWVYTVRVKKRDDFVRKMKENGIAVSQVHARNDKHDCLKEFRCPLPGMDVLAEEMICLPCGWWVTPGDREYIVDCIHEGW